MAKLEVADDEKNGFSDAVALPDPSPCLLPDVTLTPLNCEYLISAENCEKLTSWVSELALVGFLAIFAAHSWGYPRTSLSSWGYM
jgi:hypothetical protein